MCATPLPATIYPDLEHENGTLDRWSDDKHKLRSSGDGYKRLQVHGASRRDCRGVVEHRHPCSEADGRAYEGFLGLPVLVVLAVMWVAGAALLGSCALVVYMVGSVLLLTVVGSL
jgi:hypothetical protein